MGFNKFFQGINNSPFPVFSKSIIMKHIAYFLIQFTKEFDIFKIFLPKFFISLIREVKIDFIAQNKKSAFAKMINSHSLPHFLDYFGIKVISLKKSVNRNSFFFFFLLC